MNTGIPRHVPRVLPRLGSAGVAAEPGNSGAARLICTPDGRAYAYGQPSRRRTRVTPAAPPLRA